MAPRILLTAIWAVGTCHRPLSWIAGHSYCPLPLLLMRYNTAAVWFSQPEIVSLMSLSLRAIRAVLDCPTSSLLLWAEDIVSAAPCCQNWHPPVLGSQPIVLSCIRTFSETQLWCSAWSLRRRCSWVRIARSHWIGNSVYCLRHRLMSQLSRWLPFSREPQDYDLARKAMAWGWYPTYSRERHYLSCAATQPSLSELWSVVDSDISVVKD